ncbi:MAG: nitrous oxide-stimulated promoter family protein [Blastocatellia bacterium]|nr:nitrous oxide-stimulated promoter family protein [Blastocatellia bacterium]
MGRLSREHQTVEAMIRIYCHDKHLFGDELCDSCQELLNYAAYRIVRCPFGDDKPSCAKCTIHCYNAKMRDKIKEVMRYSGPRMVVYHPILSLAHYFDSLKGSRELPR